MGLITAKGMPDVASRALVTRLSNELSIPALGICDWNPGGLFKPFLSLFSSLTKVLLSSLHIDTDQPASQQKDNYILVRTFTGWVCWEKMSSVERTNLCLYLFMINK